MTTTLKGILPGSQEAEYTVDGGLLQARYIRQYIVLSDDPHFVLLPILPLFAIGMLLLTRVETS